MEALGSIEADLETHVKSFFHSIGDEVHAIGLKKFTKKLEKHLGLPYKALRSLKSRIGEIIAQIFNEESQALETQPHAVANIATQDAAGKLMNPPDSPTGVDLMQLEADSETDDDENQPQVALRQVPTTSSRPQRATMTDSHSPQLSPSAPVGMDESDSEWEVVDDGNDEAIAPQSTAPASSPVPPPPKRKKTAVVSNNAVDRVSNMRGAWDGHFAMLNQTDVSFGSKGHNKYYCVWVQHRPSNQRPFVVHSEWGRVGAINPLDQEKQFLTADEAVKEFERKFKSKTGNAWGDRDAFRPKPNKYTLVQLADRELAASGHSDSPGRKRLHSVLPGSVQELVKLICSKDLLDETVNQIGFNISKCPLGELHGAQLQRAYAVLGRLSRAIVSCTERGTPPAEDPTVSELTNAFYTMIPHNYGMSRPPIISSLSQLRQKLEMLQTLGQVTWANGFLNSVVYSAAAFSVLDECYRALNMRIVENLDSRELVMRMLREGHGPTHTSYTMRLCHLFATSRESHDARYQAFRNLPNRMMLWHGSRLGNLVGILGQGLRIAPPEAPATGYMFGKGLYFADCPSKSANYCHADVTNPYGVLLLCEVACGNQYELTEAKCMAGPPSCFHSVKGVGKFTWNQSSSQRHAGVLYPVGLESTDASSSSLQYNEYIVYDPAQVVIRYLALVKFNFKGAQ